ncbi:hypothetical protein LMRF06_2768 [Listeria monocytogenes]|nr:hypothetical protein LMRF06_2768 [Listeria monocytogenes]
MNTNRKKATPLFVIGGFCLILFITIASAIATESNWVARFDLSWIEKIRGGIQPDKTAIVKFMTTLGSAETTIILTIVVVLILFFLRKFVVGLWFGGTMLVCGVVLNLVLKSLVGRTRPASVNWLVSESGFSFPSGHATATAVFLWSCSDVLDFHSAKNVAKNRYRYYRLWFYPVCHVYTRLSWCAFPDGCTWWIFPWYSIGIYLTRRLFLSTKTIT